jgi:hypothetical protein
VGADRSRRDPELPGGRTDIQVEENAEHDHLTLPGRQTPRRGQRCCVQASVRGAGQPVRTSLIKVGSENVADTLPWQSSPVGVGRPPYPQTRRRLGLCAIGAKPRNDVLGSRSV